jgi:hypothetical protein
MSKGKVKMPKYTSASFYQYKPIVDVYLVAIATPDKKSERGFVVQYDRLGLTASSWIKRAHQYPTLNEAVGVAMRIKRDDPKTDPRILSMKIKKEL